MNQLETLKQYETFLQDNQMSLIYYSTLWCGVCHVMKPQVEELMTHYPEIASAEVIMNNIPEISAQQSIFSAPTVVLYVSGKEFIRQSGYLRLDQLDELLERLTN